ncbi:putative pectate lyase [Trifolium repens]|nr:putative pectate lyase [Trifolium repens]
MVSQGTNFILWRFVLAIVIVILFAPKLSSAKQSKLMGMKMNMIDSCWRPNPEWRRHRQQLATCSVGYAGKMTNNIGNDLMHYKVTDPSDDPTNPKPDGLLDVTRGSTNVTISNNWFREQDKVMLLGHADGYVRDKNMKVTVVYNHFGPNCNQRMPRIRHGYAHVANNLYFGWMQYAIGGSMGPSLKSEANLFIAPKIGSKEVTWRKIGNTSGDKWEFHSVRDAFENGASFAVTKGGRVPKPNYRKKQNFKVVDVKSVRSLTRSAGAFQCSRTSIC